MPAVVQHLSGIVDGLDVASAKEMQVALDTPTPPGKISFAGPGKTVAELGQAVAAGVTIEMESETELRRIADIGSRLGLRPRVAVRVNPDFELKGSGMRMGGGAQQFGIDAERVPGIVRETVAMDLDFLGFHIFAGSQNLRADILADAQRKTVALAVQLTQTTGQALRYLNIGGGFGIPYTERDQPLDLSLIGANLHALMDEVVRPQARRHEGRDRTRPLHRRRGRRLHHTHRRQEGKSRPNISGGRWRLASPTCCVGQLRAGHSAQLSVGDCQSVEGCLNRDGNSRRLSMHAARSAGRRPGIAESEDRRPGGGVHGRRLRPDGQPHRVLESSASRGSLGLATFEPLEPEGIADG